MPTLPVMPVHPEAADMMTRPNGQALGPEDREYWERFDRPYEHNGQVKRGVREHRHFEYPKMLFKAKNERGEHDSFERMTVGNAAEHEGVQRRDPLWCDSKAIATEKLTKQRDDDARTAANAAAKADVMSPKAKRAYHRRSAASPDHAQE